jgi:hypothetical protein
MACSACLEFEGIEMAIHMAFMFAKAFHFMAKNRSVDGRSVGLRLWIHI